MKLRLLLPIVFALIASSSAAQTTYDDSRGAYIGVNGHLFEPGVGSLVTSGVTLGYRFNEAVDVSLQTSYRDLGRVGQLTIRPAIGWTLRFASDRMGVRGNAGMSSTFIKPGSHILWKDVGAVSDISVFRDIEIADGFRFLPRMGIFASIAQYHTYGGSRVVMTSNGSRMIELTETWLGVQFGFPLSVNLTAASSLTLEPILRSGYSTKWNGNRREAGVSLWFNL